VATDAPASTTDDSAPSEGTSSNFIRDIIDEDLESGTYDGRVYTRFPPEPNGYLHIGHAKSIVLNFGIKQDYAGRADTRCHLRFDDTNPETESMEFVESIKEAVKWLGYDWEEHLYYASDYFEEFYQFAIQLIKQGDAYVDSLDEEQIREYRGTVNEPGKPSPYRDRSVEENLDLFRRMRAGEFEDGEHVLRAKIDMSSPHMILRDPLLFRIKHADHYRQGDEWCIYPMYDYAHPLEDYLEDITHSLCTLEFDNNRRVYDWVLEHVLDEEEIPSRPRQYEFARLNLTYTIMSKRKLGRLVEEEVVDGWDDPRLPTIFGMRRRGVTPEAIRTFCNDVGVTRSESRVEVSQLEHAIRDDLNFKAPRVMAVLDPVKVVVTNWDELKDTVGFDGDADWLEVPNWPREIDKSGSRMVPFTRELYIDRDDFRSDPPEDYHRLAPGREVRLRYGYFLTCDEVVRDEDGHLVEIRGTVDPATRGGAAPEDGRSPKGTIHWVSAGEGELFEARLYDRLFDVPNPDGGDEDFTDHLNPESLVVEKGVIEPSVADRPKDTRYQFERVGYFWQDPEDSDPDNGNLIFNQIVPLRDTWAEEEERRRHEELQRKKREKEKQKQRQRERSIENKRDPVELLDAAQKQRFQRYRDDFDVSREDAAIIAGDNHLADFFEEICNFPNLSAQVTVTRSDLAKWVVNELTGLLDGENPFNLPFSPKEFVELVTAVRENVLSERAADEVLEVMAKPGTGMTHPLSIAEDRNLILKSDPEELSEFVEQVIDENMNKVERYRKGKTGLLGFFMGQVMEKTGGSADPQVTRRLLKRKLEP
jgi:glutaminyl-tRNA synthetase